MKVLVFNGSPKGENSNTMKLTRAFCAGIAGATNAEVEVLPVYGMEIRDCTGCFCCWSKTPGKCCLRDDMERVLEKMLLADVIIWSFPLYYFGLPSRLKALMDRQLPLILPFMAGGSESGSHPTRHDLSGKRYVAISTCGFYTAEGNYGAVNEQFDRIYGKGGYTTIYCGEGELFRVSALRQRTDEYLEYVKAAGAEFVTGGVQQSTRQQLSELLYPREVFEQMADADWGVRAEAARSAL